jgi:class 3 adenylate cyclase/tetratricopeptide (TPR) repeat protein
MQCPQCKVDNRDGARFCRECGAPFRLACASCGVKLEPGSKFCDGCGAPVAGRPAPARAVAESPAAPPSPAVHPRFASPGAYTPKHLAEKILSAPTVEGERKQVTVLFADLKGSFELLADRDPEECRALINPVLEHMLEAVHRFEGTVDKVLGDGIMALFGAPVSHEDHAVRACYAALRMQDSVKRYAEAVRRENGVPIQIRVGLNSGEVYLGPVGSDLHVEYTAIGQTTHLAARMEQMAVPGSILMSPYAMALAEGYVQVKPLGPMPVKGLAAPVEVYELTGAGPVRSRLQASATRGLSKFVGRGVEIERLEEALERAREGHGQIVAVVGDPGVGKSRLYWEFTHSSRMRGWLIVESSSVSYGKATPYLPIIDLLRAYFQVEPRDDPRKIREKVTGKVLSLDRALEPSLPALLSLLDVPVEDPEWQRLDPPQRRQRTLDGVKRMLLRETQVQPVLVIFEDLHWIDGETQALLDSLVESLPSARMLLLVNYRPEYQHGWGGKTYYSQLRIDPLQPESADELLSALVGEDPGLEPLKQRLIEQTQGNAFFLEESVRTLVETHVLEGTRGAYRLAKALPGIQVPATVQAVLAARIDRLPAEDKHLLQAAAVIGLEFPLALLQAIAEEPEEALHRGLTHLQGAEFLYETRLFPDLAYTFKHGLTHQVAYGTLLHDRRRKLHTQIVNAIEELYPGRLAEHMERLADHAFRGELWERAVGFLRQASAKAAARSAYREAAAGFEQALVALGHLPESRERAQQGIDIRFDLRTTLQAVGEHERVFEHLRAAEALASTLGDRDRMGWSAAYLSQYLWRIGDPRRAEEMGQRALAIAAELDDFALEVVTNFFLGQGYFNVGDYRHAIDHCRRNVAILQGERAYERLGLTGLPAVLSRATLAGSLAERGEFAEAMAHAEAALAIGETAVQPYSVSTACLWLGQVHLARGDLSQAIPVLERGVGLCKTWNIRVNYQTTAAALGLAYAACGRVAEALPMLEEGGPQAAPGRLETSTPKTTLGSGYLQAGKLEEAAGVAAHAAELADARGLRGSQAKAAHLLGEIGAHRDPPQVAEAEGHYRRALVLAEELGMRPLVAHCHLGLGELHRKSGRREPAREHLAAATTLYRELGMAYWLAKAEAARATLG